MSTPMLHRALTLLPLLAAVLLLVAGATPGEAAQVDLGSQTLGRSYWHVFAAYAIAWVLVTGWLFSIGRRLAEVERRLEE